MSHAITVADVVTVVVTAVGVAGLLLGVFGLILFLVDMSNPFRSGH